MSKTDISYQNYTQSVSPELYRAAYNVPFPTINSYEISPLTPVRNSSYQKHFKNKCKKSRHTGTHQGSFKAPETLNDDSVACNRSKNCGEYPFQSYNNDINFEEKGCYKPSSKTWPKHQHLEHSTPFSAQDDHKVRYLHELEENARLIQQQQQERVSSAKYAHVNKRNKLKGGNYDALRNQTKHQPMKKETTKATCNINVDAECECEQELQEGMKDITETGLYNEKKNPESKLNKSRLTEKQKDLSLETFKPSSSVEQTLHSNVSENDVNKLPNKGDAVEEFHKKNGINSSGAFFINQQTYSSKPTVCCVENQNQMPTATLKRSKNKIIDNASQINTLERKMAEVAERNKQSEAFLLENGFDDAPLAETFNEAHKNNISCDTCDAPLTPAFIEDLDHPVVENRPLTRSHTRATTDECFELISLSTISSGLYGILLFVISVALLVSEISTDYIPLHYFEGFFTFLYIGGILFLLYIFCYILHETACCGPKPPSSKLGNPYFRRWSRDAISEESPTRQKQGAKIKQKYKISENSFSHASFFLRVGGIVFGLGTLLYNGVELATFFEIPWNSPCYQVLRGINPILQMIFTFSQIYFIFMNARINIHRFQTFARIGLAHLIATNFCIWIRSLIKECHREIVDYKAELGYGFTEDYMILEGYNSLRRRFGSDSLLVNGLMNSIMNAIKSRSPKGSFFEAFFLDNNLEKIEYNERNNVPLPNEAVSTKKTWTEAFSKGPFDNLIGEMNHENRDKSRNFGLTLAATSRVGYRSNDFGDTFLNIESNITCGRLDVLGDIMAKATPYLYPFVTEYSILAAGFLLSMWFNVGRNPRYWGEEEDHLSVASRKITNFPKNDCIGTSKGLFFGLLTLISGIISLILFFILIKHRNNEVSGLATLLIDFSHGIILTICIFATILGFVRINPMRIRYEYQSSVEQSLLLFSSCGIFAYSTFGFIAGVFNAPMDVKNMLALGTGIMTVLQVYLQLLFIMDARKRRISTAAENLVKPGRQNITFLMLANLTLWILLTFENQKVQENPVQLQFFGFSIWVMIQKTMLPLSLFHRFLSTIVLGNIWKNSYKLKFYE